MVDAEQRRPGSDVEDDFVSPLTMVRGVLEMLRDSDLLADGAARRFVQLALDDCDRLGESIDRLIEGNPEAVKHTLQSHRVHGTQDPAVYRQRLTFLERDQIIEVDFSDVAFSTSDAVNGFYDAIDQAVSETGQKWYFMVNHRNCTIAPEAWMASAHRGRQTNKMHSLGTVRYAVPVDAKQGLLDEQHESAEDASMFKSRQAAIDFLRNERAAAN